MDRLIDQFSQLNGVLGNGITDEYTGAFDLPCQFVDGADLLVRRSNQFVPIPAINTPIYFISPGIDHGAYASRIPNRLMRQNVQTRYSDDGLTGSQRQPLHSADADAQSSETAWSTRDCECIDLRQGAPFQIEHCVYGGKDLFCMCPPMAENQFRMEKTVCENRNTAALGGCIDS